MPLHVPAARSASYPRRAGNAVRPLVDGEPAFRRICEAVEAARQRVWVTVAFVDPEVAMPDGRGSFFDVLGRAAARGLDVRALFWREPRLGELLPDSRHFAGTEDEWRWLAARDARFAARWDHLPDYCHHQKSWVIDAGEPGEIGFVGGINLDHGSIVPPGHPWHPGEPSTHDVYCELRGPAVTDVAHNFVQRWNEASDRAASRGCWPDERSAGDLPFPRTVGAAAGDVPVQITRTVRRNRYTARIASPGAAPFAIDDGEASILEQYGAAIDAAQSTVYLENQFLHAPSILAALEAACRRGVEVVFVVPGEPMVEIRRARKDPRFAIVLTQLAALGAHPNFTLACLARRTPTGWRDVYVHAKLMLVDDVWGTIGSANVANRSFHGDTELNASFWDPGTTRALRIQLLTEHLGIDTSALAAATALRRFAERARDNQGRRARDEEAVGLAVAIEPRDYAS